MHKRTTSKIFGHVHLPWYGSPALAGGAKVSRTVPGSNYTAIIIASELGELVAASNKMCCL